MKVTVLTSDKRNWLLRGFFYQWDKYARRDKDQGGDFLDVEVAGFTRPAALPSYAAFYSIGNFADYPINKWSDALIKYLQELSDPDDLVAIFLEDYWLLRKINRTAIATAYGFMTDHPEVIRFDIAADRMFNRSARYAGSYGSLDICKGKGEYSCSFQASIWRKSLLLEILKPGETPWEAELRGSDRLNHLPYEVVGSYQWPVNYAIVVNKGEMDTQGEWMYPARTLNAADWKALKSLGYDQPEKIN